MYTRHELDQLNIVSSVIRPPFSLCAGPLLRWLDNLARGGLCPTFPPFASVTNDTPACNSIPGVIPLDDKHLPQFVVARRLEFKTFRPSSTPAATQALERPSRYQTVSKAAFNIRILGCSLKSRSGCESEETSAKLASGGFVMAASSPVVSRRTANLDALSTIWRLLMLCYGGLELFRGRRWYVLPCPPNGDMS